MNFLKVISTISFVLSSATAVAGGDPSSAKIKLYSVSVSASADCSRPRLVFNSDDPVIVDFANSPALGGGALADGTYRCMILRISDVITFTPASSDGDCVAGTTYRHHLMDDNPSYQSFDGTNWGRVLESAKDMDNPEVVPIVLTTAGSGSSTQGMFIKPGTSTDNGPLYLGGSFIVNGSRASSIVALLKGKVDGTDPPCFLSSVGFAIQ